MDETGTTTLNVLTIPEAAKLLQLTPRTVHRMIQNKKLPGVFRIGGQWRLNESELAQWLEDGCPRLEDGTMRDL